MRWGSFGQVDELVAPTMVIFPVRLRGDVEHVRAAVGALHDRRKEQR
jgi:hypothetical protein